MYLDALDTYPPFQHRKIRKWKIPLKSTACSFGWWLMAGADLF
jgi:hypothetical protein